MKIICVGYFHGAGGAEKQIIKLANELSMRGQIVTVIALSECKIQYEINRQVNLVNLFDEKVDGIFARFRKFKRVVKEMKPDLIINYWFQSAYFSIAIPKKYRGKVIYSERGDPGDKEYRGLLGIIRKIIDIFNAVHKKRRDSFLVLIGGDEDGRMSVIKERIHNYGLGDYVRFLGVRDDATAIISCFDVFILPSRSECLPLVMIEAQALGIKCVVSDAVPNDVICNSNCVRISLNESDESWAESILIDSQNVCDGDIYKFDKKNVISQLIGLYEKIAG